MSAPSRYRRAVPAPLDGSSYETSTPRALTRNPYSETNDVSVPPQSHSRMPNAALNGPQRYHTRKAAYPPNPYAPPPHTAMPQSSIPETASYPKYATTGFPQDDKNIALPAKSAGNPGLSGNSHPVYVNPYRSPPRTYARPVLHANTQTMPHSAAENRVHLQSPTELKSAIPSPPAEDPRYLRLPAPRLDKVDRLKNRDHEDYPNRHAIERLLAATGGNGSSAPASTPASSATKDSRAKKAAPAVKHAVTIRLPTRQVTKHIEASLTAGSLAVQLVSEHRLEFDFVNDNSGESDDLIIWECFDGTRRPLRATESVVSVLKRWPARCSKHYLRTTSTTLRNDVDSLASLVPRRDMLRTPPTILAAEVHFSRPSVMYNPHAPPSRAASNAMLARSASTLSRQGSTLSRQGSTLMRAPSTHQWPHEPIEPKACALQRVPSKLNPTDDMLSAHRVETDNDDIVMQSQLVWGFGSLDLVNGRVVLKQKPGDELVCSLEAAGSDVYEWMHPGPKKYVVVLKSQQANSQAVYISTDSAKVYSVLRNAVFTARSRALQRLP